MNLAYYCQKKDCYWSEIKVFERKEQIKKMNQINGIRVVEEVPLFCFYKSKNKQLKTTRSKCNEPTETLCQNHYFQKKIINETCKQCQEEHDYDEFQTNAVKNYEDKKRKISENHNKTDRYLDYLSAYLQYELNDQKQANDIDQQIKRQQYQPADRQLSVAIQPSSDLFTLEQLYKIDNLPVISFNPIRIDDKNKKDLLIMQNVSGYDKKISHDKGINQLLNRYPLMKQ